MASETVACATDSSPAGSGPSPAGPAFWTVSASSTRAAPVASSLSAVFLFLNPSLNAMVRRYGAPPPAHSAIHTSLSSASGVTPRRPDDGGPAPVPVGDLDPGLVAGDGHPGVNRLAAGDHADELQLELPVSEEILAPLVEQESVGGPGGLHALGHQAGQAQALGLGGLGVEVAPPGVGVKHLV